MKYVESSKNVFLETGTRFPREVIWAVGLVKLASARVNVALGQLDVNVGASIEAETKKLIEGEYDAQVTVDVFQTGSGTGLNMNANELIAEFASMRLRRQVHPNDHVNMSQSSNDVGPTAVRIAAVVSVNKQLIPSLQGMSASLHRLSRKTSQVYKPGRTHLRDALPVTMGQEFGAYADTFSRDASMVEEAVNRLLDIPLGGTAVGTGLNADSRFGPMVAKEIAKESGFGFAHAKNTFRATRLLTDVAALSSTLRIVSVDLYRLCQDMRLMFSGPVTGLGEIDIPTQGEIPGSS